MHDSCPATPLNKVLQRSESSAASIGPLTGMLICMLVHKTVMAMLCMREACIAPPLQSVPGPICCKHTCLMRISLAPNHRCSGGQRHQQPTAALSLAHSFGCLRMRHTQTTTAIRCMKAGSPVKRPRVKAGSRWRGMQSPWTCTGSFACAWRQWRRLEHAG